MFGLIVESIKELGGASKVVKNHTIDWKQQCINKNVENDHGDSSWRWEMTTSTSNFDNEMMNNLDTWTKMNNKTRNAKERWSKNIKRNQLKIITFDGNDKRGKLKI